MKTKPKLIGRGSFTKAFLQAGKCILHTVDPVKLALSENLFVPSHRMFPKMKRIDSFYSGNTDVHVIEMAYMPRPKSIKKNITPRQWRLYKALQEVSFKSIYKYFATAYDRTNALYGMFEDMPSEFRQEKEALIEMVDGLRNYCDNVAFEISPRNVTVKGGKLILLDCFFDPSVLQKTRSGAIKF